MPNTTTAVELPEFMLCDFETGAEGFIKSDYVVGLDITNTSPSAPSPVTGSRMLELESDYVSGQTWRIVSKTLPHAMDISKVPFFLGYFASYGVDGGNIGLRLRFTDSNNHSHTETLEISANTWNKIKINLSNWEYKNDLKVIEIAFRSPTYASEWHSRHQVDAIGFTSYYDWNFDANGDFGGWLMQNHVSGTVSNGTLVTTLTGTDPFIANHNVYFDADDVKYIRLRVKNNTAGSEGAIYWATSTAGWDAGKRVSFAMQPNDTEFRDIVIDMSASTAWTGIVQDIRLDLPENNAVSGSTVIYEAITFGTRPSSVSGAILSVTATETAIVVQGQVTCTEAKTLSLVELQPYQEYNPNSYTPLSTTVQQSGSTSFSITIPRYDNQRDRIYSKYVVVADAIPLGVSQYVTVYPAAVNQYDYPSVPSIKGLQVQMPDDASLLGINHAALNCSLSELFYKNATVAPTNTISYSFEGETYYFNKGAVQSLDRDIKALSDDKVNVTLILFYMGSLVSDDYPYEITRHPDYVDGAGAAFNTTNQAGTQYWKAACEFLASRYTRTDQKYGRVLNYVVGNEVCVAGVWHDTGNKQINEFVDDYGRTFRIAYTAMRKYQANVRLHISLDNHWNSMYLPNEPLRNYRGKDVTDFFNSEMALHGNIPWCMAYHPYPTDMQDPYIWNDSIPTDNANTPRITFKNLQVLPAYLSQQQFLYNGQLRTINLTEQGFTSTNPYDLQSQKVQAAAYCYAYYKARFTAGIESFIYHRHVDFTGEGIWVGLWNNVSGSYAPNQPYQHKYIYDVFQKIDTALSLQVSAFALPIIGADSWSDIIQGFDANVLNEMPTAQSTTLSVVSAISPSVAVSDFETSTDGWYKGPFSTGVARVSAFSNAPGTAYQGSYVLENSFKLMADAGGATGNAGATKMFSPAVDATETPVIQLAINSYGALTYANNYYVKVLVYSGYNTIIGTGAMQPNQWNRLAMDLSTWEHKNAIDKIKVWFSTDSSAEWIAAYQIDNFGFVAIS